MADKLWQVLLKTALETEEYEITCLECFNLLDQYADLLLEGADPAELLPSVQQHLNHCPACTQEFETLLLMLQKAAREADIL